MNDRIDWRTKTEEERARYNYYISLGYEDVTAAVLSLYTYGDARGAVTIPGLYREITEPAENEPEPAPVERCSLSGGQPSLFLDMVEDADLPESDVCYSVPSPGPMAAPCFAGSFEVDDAFMDTMSFSLSTEDYEPIEEKHFRPSLDHATSTFRMTTNTASAGILLNQLRNRCSITKDMVRIEEFLNYFRYREEKPEKGMFRLSSELKKLDSGNRLLYLHVQGREETREKQNIVLLLDVSGSMYSENVQTQAAVSTIVSKLKKGDTFSLVTYSCEDKVILSGFTVEDETRDRKTILEKLLGIEIDGYTDGSSGIERAYQIGKKYYIPDGNNQVILITDGDLNFGITDKGGLEQLIEAKKKNGLFLSVLGTGIGNYKDDKLEVLSKHGNGVYRVINNLADVQKSIRDDYASLTNVIAKDVKAQVEFNPEIVSSYRLLGFENRELSHGDFRNDSVISEPFGSGGHCVALYELEMKGADPLARDGDYKYRKIVTTGSDELGTVKLRYKEPLADTSQELELVIPSAGEHYSDNLKLAHIVYVCAEKLRDSDFITQQDIATALAEYDELGMEIRLLNASDIEKLREILRRSKEKLKIRTAEEPEDEFMF